MTRLARLKSAARRQASFAAVVAALVCGTAVPLGLMVRDQYASTTTAAYDPTDGIGVPMTTSGGSRFPQIAATLKARLAEPEFLWQVALAVELSLNPETGEPLGDDSSTKAKVAKLLGPTLRGSADLAGQTLTVAVLADDALTAKRLADAVMELFIQKELRFEAETYFRLHESHARFLEDVRAERAKNGPPSPAQAVDDEEFVPRLDERVRELDLERRRLAAQIDQPATRTRLRVTVPATYDDVPVKRLRRRFALASALLGALLVAGLATLRETTTPIARSARRVETATGLAVVAEVRRSTFERFPRLSKDRAAALRDGAKSGAARDPEAAVWQDFQDVERAISRVAVGPVLFLVAPGKAGTCAFLHNLLCVTAFDQNHTRLVIDGDTADPLGTPDERRRALGDLGRYLAGKVPWKEIRLTRTPDRPYDLVYATATEGDGKSTYSAAVLARLFTSLCRGYGRVFVRGHELRHAVENGELAKAATDAFLVVDARTTRLTEVERAVNVVGRTKLRGVILIGT